MDGGMIIQKEKFGNPVLDDASFFYFEFLDHIFLLDRDTTTRDAEMFCEK